MNPNTNMIQLLTSAKSENVHQSTNDLNVSTPSINRLNSTKIPEDDIDIKYKKISYLDFHKSQSVYKNHIKNVANPTTETINRDHSEKSNTEIKVELYRIELLYYLLTMHKTPPPTFRRRLEF